MKLKFVHLLGFTAFLLASAAAFYSVYGLSQLFSGAKWPVIIMAGSLELAKLVSASFVYRYWEKISKLFKTYFITGIIVLMTITSIGIYGFLTNAYQKSSNELQMVDSQIRIIDTKKTFYIDNVQRFNDQIILKNNRVESLTNLRTQQETRLDSLYKKGLITSAKRTEKLIQQTTDDINAINKDVEKITINIQVQNDSINKFDLQILNLKNTTAGDLGPLKYISEVSGLSMNMVVNYLVLLLIFVFDPLAVCLVIATNIVLKEFTPVKKPEEDISSSNVSRQIKEPEPIINEESELSKQPEIIVTKAEQKSPHSSRGHYTDGRSAP